MRNPVAVFCLPHSLSFHICSTASSHQFYPQMHPNLHLSQPLCPLPAGPTMPLLTLTPLFIAMASNQSPCLQPLAPIHFLCFTRYVLKRDCSTPQFASGQFLFSHRTKVSLLRRHTRSFRTDSSLLSRFRRLLPGHTCPTVTRVSHLLCGDSALCPSRHRVHRHPCPWLPLPGVL